MKWFARTDQHIELTLFVKPKAKKTAIVSCNENLLAIALHAKPVEGEANRELIRFLADFLDVPKTTITLCSGDRSRHKRVMIHLNETNKRQGERIHHRFTQELQH